MYSTCHRRVGVSGATSARAAAQRHAPVRDLSIAQAVRTRAGQLQSALHPAGARRRRRHARVCAQSD